MKKVFNETSLSYFLNKAKGEDNGIVSTVINSIEVVDELPQVELEGVLYLVKEQESVKNILDDAIIIDGYISSSTSSINQASGSGDKILYFPCEGNKTYKINKASAGVRFRVGTTDTVPTDSTSVSDFVKNDTAASITIATSSSAKYIVVYFWTSSDSKTYQDVFDSMSVEEV